MVDAEPLGFGLHRELGGHFRRRVAVLDGLLLQRVLHRSLVNHLLDNNSKSLREISNHLEKTLSIFFVPTKENELAWVHSQKHFQL